MLATLQYERAPERAEEGDEVLQAGWGYGGAAWPHASARSDAAFADYL